MTALAWHRDGLTREEGYAVEGLQRVESDNRDLARIILGLPWVADGINELEWGPLYALRLTSKADDSLIRRMVALPWFSDGIGSRYEGDAFSVVVYINQTEPQRAQRISRLPWLRDGITEPEYSGLSAVYQIWQRNASLARSVAQSPWFSDGITSQEASTILGIGAFAGSGNEFGPDWARDYALISRVTGSLGNIAGGDGSLRPRLAGMSWIADGVTENEAQVLDYMMRINLNSPVLAQRIAGHAWLSDGITEEERLGLYHVWQISNRDAGTALEIAGSPWFTDGLTGADGQTLEQTLTALGGPTVTGPFATPTPAPHPGNLHTALESAAGPDDTGEIERLLNEGADPNAWNSEGESPLHIAAAMAFPKAVTLLLDRGANVNARDNQGRTPLMTLIIKGFEPDPQVAALLLGRGADVDAKDSAGRTALQYAGLHRAPPEIVRILEDHGASSDTPDPTATPAPEPTQTPDATETPQQPESAPDPNARPDYDTDGDGLIEINYLEQLDAMRYDPDGDGVPLDTNDLDGNGSSDFGDGTSAERYAAAFPTTEGGAVCGGGGCTGYELTRSLDFDDPDSYASGRVNTAWTEEGESGPPKQLAENPLISFLEGSGWTPILQCQGYATGCTREVPLTLDGNGHTISNLFSSGGGFPGFVGLFFRTDGTIRNLGLLDVDLSGRGAPISATNHGTITGSYVTGTVVALTRTNATDSSGFVFQNYGTIRDSHSEVNVSFQAGDDSRSGHGGLAGFAWVNEGLIEDSYATGNVAGGAGFVYLNEGGTLRNCYATGDVTALGVGNAGLVDRNGGTIDTCHATGFVDWGGGLVRLNFDTIVNSHATGEVGTGGGLVYENDGGTIMNSYATGDVGSLSSILPLPYNGGLVAINNTSGTPRDAYFTPTGIFFSYATGEISGEGVGGGLVGHNRGFIIASYATGDVHSETEAARGAVAAGLVGANSGFIGSSYATGNVSAVKSADWLGLPDSTVLAGGLVGTTGGSHAHWPGRIVASYSTGRVTSEGYSGGFAGRAPTRVYNGYWDTETSGQTVGIGYHPGSVVYDIEPKTTAELQSPTDYTGIYAEWRLGPDDLDPLEDLAAGAEDSWDFGTGSQYPALKADWNGDGVATAREFGGQGR